MNSKLRRKLINALMQVPATATFEGRTGLLGTVRDGISLNRSEVNQRTALELIVDQLSEFSSDANEWPLLVFIDNALSHVRGTQVGSELLALRQQLQEVATGRIFLPCQLTRACNLDLNRLVDDSLEVLLKRRRGLVGLAVPYDDAAFRTNFCERLKDELELEKRSVQVRHCLSLKPSLIEVSEAINTIKRYRGLLGSMDVLCPIQVSSEHKSMADEFWQGLYYAFEDSFEHMLIIFMSGDLKGVFPEDVIKLTRPEFRRITVFRWIRRIAESLDWPEDIIERWRNAMIAECSRGETLDIRQVYEHLDYAVIILQQSPPPSPDRFCAMIEERSI